MGGSGGGEEDEIITLYEISFGAIIIFFSYAVFSTIVFCANQKTVRRTVYTSVTRDNNVKILKS